LIPWFAGKLVVIFSDNDAPGEAYARRVAEAIRGTAKSIKIVHFPDRHEKFDIADWISESKSEVAA
jgi:DNA primase